MYNLEGGVIWTQELKNAFKTGTTYCSVIHNQQEYNESNFLKEAELKDVKYVPNAGFIGQAVSKMLTIKMVNNEESNLNFENANVQFKIGAKYNDIIYYINYGNFIVNEPPENDDTNGTVKFIAYDYMIKFNQDYTNRVSYPCTLKDLLLDICSQAGVELGSTTFENEDFEVEDNQFEGKQLRDVLQHIAKCAFSWARIGQDNKLYLDFVVNNNIDETITTDDYKMDAFKKANEYYGPINKVTYADSDIKGQEISVQDDSSIATYGEKEIIIYDNYFAYNIEKRQELIQAGTVLFGLRYMPVQNLELIGLVYLDCTDIIGVQDGAGTTYLTRVFSHIIKYNGAVSDTIETTGESENEKTYSNPNNSVAQNSRTEIIVDRAKKEITAVVEEVGEQNQKIAVITQTVEELNSKISDIADITTSLESNSGSLTFEDINESEPIRIVVHSVGTNIAKLHPSSSLKPRVGLKPKTRIIRFINTSTEEVWNYEIPEDLLYYDNENYDEFILDYDGQSCVVNKKCKWNNDGTVGLLSSMVTHEYSFPHIELTDGDYTISLIQYSSGYIFARLMAQNIYTTQFATKAELNSEISQTVDNINLSVNERLTNYSTTSQMNSAIDLKASEITSSVSNTYATKSELNSSTSSLNSKIDQTASSISLTVDNIQEQVETAQSTADTATTKADNAQSSANSAQSTANSINNNLTTNYYTKTQTNSAINQKANEITSTVSETYSTKSETNTAKSEAIASANASTDTKLQSYSTTTQMNSAINQKANQITSTVSETYSTKTETNTAKNQAISSANSSTDQKLESYSTTTQMNSAINQKANTIMTSVNQKVGKTEVGTYIEQNTESVKLAWNQISEYIQMMIINNNASFAILDSSKKPIAYFDKTGIHFSSNNTAFGEMGVQTVDGNKFIAFSVDGTYGSAINNGMAWGIKTTSDGKFHPIFYIKNFEMGSQSSDSSFGELVLSASNLLLDGIGTGVVAGNIKIFGDPTQGDLYFYDIKNDKYPLIITPESNLSYGEISMLDNIRFYRNSQGTNSFTVGSGSSYCLFSDDGYISGNTLYIRDGGDGTITGTLWVNENIHCDGNVYAKNISSDKRLKKNIKASENNAIDTIDKIKIHSFDWKEDNSHVDYGFIAQELEEINENYVLKQEIKNKKEEVTDYKYYVNELPIIATLTKAIQEQQAQIEELQKEIKELKGGK